MNPLRSTPNPHLLEIPVRPWLRRLADAAGRTVTVGDVPDRVLDEIRDGAYHGVWLMGVWPTGPVGRSLALDHPDLRAEYSRILPGWEPADVDGSPYSIQAYEPAPALGGWPGLAGFRKRLRDRGLGLVLDFVPNHVGRDHAWLDSHPERLVTGSADDLERAPGSWFRHPTAAGPPRIFAHGRDPHFAGWSDTCQIDHRRRGAREAMGRLLRKLADRCDGLRCDVAMLVLEDVFRETWGDSPDAEPGDFWSEAIPALRRENPDTVLIAEVYWGLGPRLHDLGFDFTYDKDLCDALLGGDPAGVRARLEEPLARHAHQLRFLENHDEPRALAAFGPDRLRAAAALTYSLPGLRLFQEGQDEGRRIRTPVQLSRAPEEPVEDWCLAFHRRLREILAGSAFHQGAWAPLPVRGPDGESPPPTAALLGSLWTHGREIHAVVVNLADRPAAGRLLLPLPPGGQDCLTIRDEMSGKHLERDRRELLQPGLLVELPPFGIRFLCLEATSRFPRGSAAGGS